MGVPGAGLCNACLHQQVVRSGRGSLFSLCRRHKTDPRFGKYPPIPVRDCPGFTASVSASPSASEPPTGPASGPGSPGPAG